MFNDPWGSMQNFLGGFQQFIGNPMQFVASKKMNIPQEYMNDPNETIQYLMNTGQISQQDYNKLNNLAKKIEKSPMFKKFIGM